MTELLALAVSGLCIGAGMGASKQRAPRPVIVGCYGLAAVAFLVVLLTFGGNG